MSRTKRDAQVFENNWSYKTNSLKDFRSTYNDPENLEEGYKVRTRHGKSGYIHSWDDITPSAVYEVKYKAQIK